MPTKSIFDIEERPSDSPLVDSVWRTTSGSNPGTFTSVAQSHWSMVFTRQHGKTWVSLRGPETLATESPIPEDAEFTGIEFKHGAFMPCLPVGTLVDAPISLPDVSERSFRLLSSDWHLPDFENADAFVARLVREGLLMRDRVVEEALEGGPAGISPRTVQRRFLRATGLTPGMLFQIERAREAAEMLERGLPILDTVDQAGYADQPHLTRALRRFWGYTPRQILLGAT
jgi:AraC-like DNA-binding protein